MCHLQNFRCPKLTYIVFGGSLRNRPNKKLGQIASIRLLSAKITTITMSFIITISIKTPFLETASTESLYKQQHNTIPIKHTSQKLKQIQLTILETIININKDYILNNNNQQTIPIGEPPLPGKSNGRF
ncbi:hypothetical protein HanIR_Chr13g0630241 [Helianthus annuus]|nr:hypothetical protein HanIR_Chr13g0630241 [Helianthus annuus]